MSRADKTATNVSYDVEIDPETNLPVRMKVLLLTGQKGATILDKDGNIIGGDHVAFHFDYELTSVGKTKVQMPAKARKVFAGLKN